MDTYIKKLMNDEKIEYYGIIPFSECKVINPELLSRSIEGWTPQSVIMLCVPYYTGDHEGRNVSLYAVPRDYHIYFRELYSRLESSLTEHYPRNHFKGFADHSPIGETGAGAKAGLGVIGDKFQLINEKYGSYTFIGEILTDLQFEKYDTVPVSFCSHCGKCSEECPVENDCFSDMTQRKGELSELTKKLIKKTGIVWGCDICRSSCPMNIGVSETPIDFFREDLTPVISYDDINSMTKDEFRTRAYSWRGKNTILRNLDVIKAKPQN